MQKINHLAFIMDGNGRWAKKRKKARIFGHIKGSQNLHNIIREVARINIPYLTLYAFSLENWHRPKSEVNHLMKILVRFLKREVSTMMKEGIQLNAIGNLSHLPLEARNELLKCMEQTANNTKMVLTLALSYGSRQEIVQAAKRMALDYKEGKVDFDQIDESFFTTYLLTQNIPDPDLIIRTSGEYRLSNFLMWQAAYSELYISPKTWPDFTCKDLYAALTEYQQRERRFGKTSEQILRTKEDALEQH